MSKPKTILVIDDDPDYVAATRALLQQAGYTVHVAADGAAGLDRARAVRPDLVVLDVIMAERTEGFFLLQEIRRTAGIQDVPVIVVSSIYNEYPEFRVSPHAGWMPASLFLTKPVEPAQLLAEVARLLALPRAAEAHAT